MIDMRLLNHFLGIEIFFLGKWDYGDLVGVICNQNVGRIWVGTCNLIALPMMLGLKLTFDMRTPK
jgi:hypothetical protein